MTEPDAPPWPTGAAPIETGGVTFTTHHGDRIAVAATPDVGVTVAVSNTTTGYSLAALTDSEAALLVRCVEWELGGEVTRG